MTNQEVERRSLEAGKWANLVMGISGVAAALASRSDALLVDGLYSGANFISAIIAARISMAVAKPADRRFPFGYDAFEALYVKYRSLVLLGILLFAMLGAVSKIVTYATGGEVPELVFGPIVIYMVAMVGICFGLAAWHRTNWTRTGKTSELLLTESRAAVVDGVISAGAGAGLLAAALLRGTALGGIVPIADSIIVLVMCAAIITQPIRMFWGSLREVAGAAADPETVSQVRERVESTLRKRPVTLLDVVVAKVGRGYYVLSYLRPESAVSGAEADTFWGEIDTAISDLVGQSKSEIVICDKSPYE